MQIGIFDSGVGGLTAALELERLVPDVDYIYFGDTARIPYGTRSVEVINKYAMQDCRFLLEQNVGAVLAACGTVSSNSLELLNKSFTTPIIGVVEPAAKKAVSLASNGRIAVLGTAATIRSLAFEKAIKSADPTMTVIQKACPMFVPLVENGYISKDDPVTRLIVQEYLAEIIPHAPSVVILGCTHYPLLSAVISEFLPQTTLIDSSAEAAAELVRTVGADNVSKTNKRVFYTSDNPDMFEESALNIMKRSINGLVYKADVDDKTER